MTCLKKIKELSENLEISLNLGGEYAHSIAKMLSEYGTDVLVLERAKTYEELFEQLVKMRGDDVTSKLTQECNNLADVLNDSARSVADLAETFNKLASDLNEGDSSKGEE